MPCEPHRTSAAVEPKVETDKFVPDITIQTTLDEIDQDDAEMFESVLHKFGFHPKTSKMDTNQIGDETEVVCYYAETITFKGSARAGAAAFAKLVKHLHDHQDKLHVDMPASLLSRWVREYLDEMPKQHAGVHFNHDGTGHEVTYPGNVYVGAAAEPGSESVKKLKILSFRMLLPGHSSLYNAALSKAHAFIKNALVKYKIEYSNVLDKAGDVFGVDTREDGEAATDVTTFEIYDVEAPVPALLAFANILSKHGDFYGDENEFLRAVRGGHDTVHASAADHKKFSHAHKLFHDFIGWSRSGRNLGAIAENKLHDKFNGLLYTATFGVSTKLDLMGSYTKWKVYLNLVADEKTSGYQVTLAPSGELAVVRMGTKPETFSVHVPASEDEPHELARVIVEECLKHLPKTAEAAAAVVMPAIGVVDCYRRLLTALAMRYHKTKFSVAPDIHAVVGSGNVRPYGQMRVLQLSSDYTDAPCSVYPDTADGIIVDIQGVKHPLPIADCAAPAALLREVVHMYRDKARQLATASVDADIAEIEAFLVTAAAEPVPTDPNADPDAPKPYVHAIDGKVRGLLQLMTKWTAGERNAEGKEDMRKILIELKKLCWPRLSEASKKKLLELK